MLTLNNWVMILNSTNTYSRLCKFKFVKSHQPVTTKILYHLCTTLNWIPRKNGHILSNLFFFNYTISLLIHVANMHPYTKDSIFSGIVQDTEKILSYFLQVGYFEVQNSLFLLCSFSVRKLPILTLSWVIPDFFLFGVLNVYELSSWVFCIIWCGAHIPFSWKN